MKSQTISTARRILVDVAWCSNSGMLQPEQRGGAVEPSQLRASFVSYSETHLIVSCLFAHQVITKHKLHRVFILFPILPGFFFLAILLHHLLFPSSLTLTSAPQISSAEQLFSVPTSPPAEVPLLCHRAAPSGPCQTPHPLLLSLLPAPTTV